MFKSLRNLGTALLFSFLLAQPALATPEEDIAISDNVFGIGETHLFILRSVDSNLGLHITGMRDLYLVGKNLTTGVDELIWPIQRVYSGYDADGKISIITHFPLKDAINPYDILAEFNAWPIPGPMYSDPEDTWLGADMLISQEDTMPLDTMFSQIQQTIDFMIANMLPYPARGYQSGAYYTPAEMMPEIPLVTEFCEINGVSTRRATNEVPSSHLVRIRCFEGGMGRMGNIVVVMPESGKYKP